LGQYLGTETTIYIVLDEGRYSTIDYVLQIVHANPWKEIPEDATLTLFGASIRCLGIPDVSPRMVGVEPGAILPVSNRRGRYSQDVKSSLVPEWAEGWAQRTVEPT
jgi:hypothetical protein